MRDLEPNLRFPHPSSFGRKFSIFAAKNSYFLSGCISCCEYKKDASIWVLFMLIFTSLVFHRCRWVGKWSDFGRDSRLSGSLIGSPSENVRVRIINESIIQPVNKSVTQPLYKSSSHLLYKSISPIILWMADCFEIKIMNSFLKVQCWFKRSLDFSTKTLNG